MTDKNKKIELVCFREIVIFNPHGRDLNGLQQTLRDAFDAFVIEIGGADLAAFHCINRGKHRLFVYVADGDLGTPPYRTFDAIDETRCIPNAGTWFITVGRPEWDTRVRRDLDFHDLGAADFDAAAVVREEDRRCAYMYPNEYRAADKPCDFADVCEDLNALCATIEAEGNVNPEHTAKYKADTAHYIELLHNNGRHGGKVSESYVVQQAYSWQAPIYADLLALLQKALPRTREVRMSDGRRIVVFPIMRSRHLDLRDFA